MIDLQALEISDCVEKEKPHNEELRMTWEQNNRIAKSHIYSVTLCQKFTDS